MSEEKTNAAAAVEVQDSQPQTKESLLNALKQDFSTSVTKVYVNSLNREVCFSEIKVKEQKTLTRITASNENRKDIIYDAYCALINKACLEDGFDVYKLLEFDRLKLMLALYQANMFSNDVKFKCSECGAENVYKIDFDNVIKRLDEFDISPEKFHYENNKFEYDFVLQFPTVSRVSKFYAHRSPLQQRLSKKQLAADDNMQNIEYADLFIRTLTFKNKQTKKVTNIDFDAYPVGDIDEILNAFPQDVLYTDNGVLKHIVDHFLATLNAQFDKHTCANCGAVHEKGDVNNSESFF